MTAVRKLAMAAAVLTIAHITAGTTNNVIPETAFLEGTLRTLSGPVRARLLGMLCRWPYTSRTTDR